MLRIREIPCSLGIACSNCCGAQCFCSCFAYGSEVIGQLANMVSVVSVNVYSVGAVCREAGFDFSPLTGFLPLLLLDDKRHQTALVNLCWALQASCDTADAGPEAFTSHSRPAAAGRSTASIPTQRVRLVCPGSHL